MACHIRLELYNTLGQKILIVEDAYKTAGMYQVNVDASNLPSGIILYRIRAGEFLSVRKMVLLK